MIILILIIIVVGVIVGTERLNLDQYRLKFLLLSFL
jgi:hypothetical protein